MLVPQLFPPQGSVGLPVTSRVVGGGGSDISKRHLKNLCCNLTSQVGHCTFQNQFNIQLKKKGLKPKAST